MDVLVSQPGQCVLRAAAAARADPTSGDPTSGDPTSGTITPLGRVHIWGHSHPWDHPTSGMRPHLGLSHIWDHPTSGLPLPSAPAWWPLSLQLPGCTARRTSDEGLGMADEPRGGCFLLAQTVVRALCNCTATMSGAERNLLHGTVDLECSFCPFDAHGEESSPAPMNPRGSYLLLYPLLRASP